MDTNYRSCSIWWLLWIHAACLIIQRIKSSDEIYWKLFTKPAVFGDDVILECKFPERTCCHRFARRWLGGTDLRLLVMNGASVYPLKYTESFRPESYSSKLTIHSLNATDVNVQYACTYGFVKDVKVLELTEEDFETLQVGLFSMLFILSLKLKPYGVEYHILKVSSLPFVLGEVGEMVKDDEGYPSEPLEANITTSTENMLLVNISMEDVFPKPNCTASLDANDVSEFIKMSSVVTTTLFAVSITISYFMPLASCFSCFHIACRVGTKLLELQKNVTCGNYKPMDDKESKALLIISFVLITAAMAFICLTICSLILSAYIDRFGNRNQTWLVRFGKSYRTWQVKFSYTTRYRRPLEDIT